MLLRADATKDVMAHETDREKRVSGVTDRRETLGGGGRRAEDHRAAQFSSIIPCPACGVAWAALSSVAHEEEPLVATYICPRCDRHEIRVAAV
jgi:hypothetical protein